MATKDVLIVEDDDSIREMIAFHLKRAGFAVREASDVLAARTHLVERHPDIILIDWNLPGISGLEFTRALKADRFTRKLPVILLTARATEEDKVTGLGDGADDYVTKPFSPQELVARIHALFRRSILDAGEAPHRGTDRRCTHQATPTCARDRRVRPRHRDRSGIRVSILHIARCSVREIRESIPRRGAALTLFWAQAIRRPRCRAKAGTP